MKFYRLMFFVVCTVMFTGQVSFAMEASHIKKDNAEVDAMESGRRVPVGVASASPSHDSSTLCVSRQCGRKLYPCFFILGNVVLMVYFATKNLEGLL